MRTLTKPSEKGTHEISPTVASKPIAQKIVTAATSRFQKSFVALSHVELDARTGHPVRIAGAVSALLIGIVRPLA